MKYVFLAALVLVTVAEVRAEGEAAATDSAKVVQIPVDTVKTSEDASSTLFDRVRGAYLRAVKHGVVETIKG